MATGRDNIDLIWNVGELVHLFERETSVESFLQDVVELIADHMEADVCSVYLLDERTDVLVLRATRGLSKASVGKVTLEPGEGITGAALKELRPIIADKASSNPHFKLIPGLDEEPYQAFLAVPIRHGLSRIGVLVLQHRRAGFFSGHDARALQVIASQLAATLENIEFLMELRKAPAMLPEGREDSRFVFIRGDRGSGGIGVGLAVAFGERQDAMVDEGAGEHRELSVPRAVEVFRSAVDATHAQLEELQYSVEDSLSDVASLIFSTHLLMLMDVEFTGRMMEAIEGGVDPTQAVVGIVNEYVSLFSRSSNPRVQEKAVDVKDLGHRIIRNLRGDDGGPIDYTGQIVVARDLFPSELVKLAAQNVEGIVLAAGSATAHVSILARSLDITTVQTRDERIFDIIDGSPLIVDGLAGTIFVNPDRAMVAEFSEKKARLMGLSEAEVEVPAIAYTTEGVRIDVAANINLFHDTTLAARTRANGIGLYRSEFPFIIRNAFPSEEEQYIVYRRIVESAGANPVVLRTLDIGGDKRLQYLDELAEPNPFLGFRGIRFSLAYPDLFRDQLRAMLRAGADADLHILFPMISSVDELLEAKDHVASCIAELAAEDLPVHPQPKLGAMVELPSAVEGIENLAHHADFLSIGTNDLVMYMIGVDRTNERVMGMYRPHHPAVLRALARVIAAADAAGKPISVCGDAAADPAVLRFLLGTGLRRLSVDPKLIPRTRKLISSLSLRHLETVSRRLLSCGSIREVETLLRDEGLNGTEPDAGIAPEVSAP